MYVSPQDRSFDPIGLSNLTSSVDDLAGGAAGEAAALLGTAGDNVSRFLPPQQSQGAAGNDWSNPIGSLIGSIGSLLSQLANYLSGGPGTTNYSATAGDQQHFENATASSTGDPHLAFNGTTETGGAANAKWDNMTSHGNLLDSDSFNGGYRISTQTTQPNANGVTFNQSATVTTNGGATRVSLDANGNATLCENGQSQSIADGQRINLGNGESVSRDANGSLTINDRDGYGGSISTTLSENGQGVDVNVSARNVDLGGYLTQGNRSIPSRPPVTLPIERGPRFGEPRGYGVEPLLMEQTAAD